ncbi:MAG TPA: hypothetical protein VF183_07885 [Acidimicrobiales bacterium]
MHTPSARSPRHRFFALTVAVAAFVVFAAGCSDDDDDDLSVTGTSAPTTTARAATTTGPPATASTTTAASAGASTTSAPATGSATVTVADTELGQVLADGDGMTLYVFTRDTAGTSNCTGACAQTWPRHAPDAVVAGPGIDASRLGTITVDGVEQVTLDGMPLYRYAADSAPGDVTGQGVGGVWFVVRPDGTLVR